MTDPADSFGIKPYRGHSGTICLVRNEHGVKMVRKRLDHFYPKTMKPREVYVQEQAIPRFDHILALDDWKRHESERVDLYFHYCEGGDLRQIWQKQWKDQPPSEPVVWDIFIQIADALAWLRKWSTHPNLCPCHRNLSLVELQQRRRFGALERRTQC